MPLVRTLLASALLALGSTAALAAPPTDAQIERLLVASRAESTLAAVMPQMEAMQQQQFEQLLAAEELDPAQRAEIDRLRQRTTEIVRRTLAWEEMRPLYLDVYRKTYTAEDVAAITEFHESPAGQAMLDKNPALMQNLMVAIQQKTTPMIEELQAELRAVSGEAPAE